MRRKTHLAILSDSRLFRDAVASRLTAEDDIEVVGSSSTVHSLLVCAQARPIDVLLVHLSVEAAVGAEVVFDLKSFLPAARVIVLGSAECGSEFVKFIEAGAVAALDHDASYLSLLDSIRAVREGRTIAASAVLSSVFRRVGELVDKRQSQPAPPATALTFREEEVTRLLVIGLLNKQISRRLGISQATVKSHVNKILSKLNKKRRRDILN